MIAPSAPTAARRLLQVLALLCMLPGAAGMDLSVPGGERLLVPVTSMKDIRFRNTRHQQFDFSCGSAALATLLTHHYAHPVSEQAIFEEMFALGEKDKIRREGFSLLDIQHYLSKHGYRADGFELPLHKLLEARLPAIVLVSDKGYHHFVVIKGIAAGRVLIGDPASGTRSLPLAQFEAMWLNRLLFVIHDFPGAVRFNDQADWAAAPQAPLAAGIVRTGLGELTMGKLGPGDF